jgi:serine protease Do
MFARFRILLPIVALGLAAVVLLLRRYDTASREPSPDWAQSAAGVVQTASKSVVAIETEQFSSKKRLTIRNAGSGFILSRSGLILTNEHVIHQADAVRVTLHDQKSLPAIIVGADVRTDMAVLKIDAGDLEPLPFAPTDSLVIGQPVIALGNPMGTGSDGQAVATFGLICRLDCSLNPDIDPQNDRFYDNLVQTTAITLPGSSGGPVINIAGQAIGLNTAVGAVVHSEKQFGFAIALDDLIRKRIELLKNGKDVPHAFLGASLAENVDPRIAKNLGMDDLSGALVESAMLGFPAQQAGIQTNDLIREIDGKSVLSHQKLMSILNHAMPRQSIRIGLLRSDPGRPGSSIRLTLPVTLALRKSADLKGYAEEAALDYLTLWGMHLKPLTPWRKDKLQLPIQQSGVLVYDLDGDSPARRLGIVPGCVITAIDNHPVRSLDDLARLAHTRFQTPHIEYITPPLPDSPL